MKTIYKHYSKFNKNMEYNHVLTKFCERKIYPNQPEYCNSLSALYIVAIGYTNLLRSYKQSKSISLIYWCMICNGISSFAFHWTGYYILRLFDEFSMIIPLWIGIYKILYDLEYSKYILGLHTGYNIAILVLDIFPWFEEYFPIAFAAELVCVVPLYYQILMCNNVIISKHYLINNKGFAGIAICSRSAAVWITTEVFCNKYLVLGHSVWHIGMSAGMCHIINFFYDKTNILKLKLN